MSWHDKWVHHHHQWPGHVQHQPGQLARANGDSDNWYVLFSFVLTGPWEYSIEGQTHVVSEG